MSSTMAPTKADWRDLATLPDDYTTVLIACDDGDVDAAFHMDGKWIWLTGHDVLAGVLAWCDMPEAPIIEQGGSS